MSVCSNALANLKFIEDDVRLSTVAFFADPDLPSVVRLLVPLGYPYLSPRHCPPGCSLHRPPGRLLYCSPDSLIVLSTARMVVLSTVRMVVLSTDRLDVKSTVRLDLHCTARLVVFYWGFPFHVPHGFPLMSSWASYLQFARVSPSVRLGIHPTVRVCSLYCWPGCYPYCQPESLILRSVPSSGRLVLGHCPHGYPFYCLPACLIYCPPECSLHKIRLGISL